ncbi:MAG TPA: Rieske (2Fe-2S) protein [Gemmatimonadaceae bacterium]|jgi:Rieske Fe-S protein
MSLHGEEPISCRGCDAARAGYGAALEQEEGIGRRTFLIQTGVMAAIAALDACGSLGGADVTAPNIPANSTITISNYSSLATVGGVAMISLGGAPVAVVRTSTSDFIALSRVCPHQGGIVNLLHNDFVCPRHGATYDLTGQWIGGQRANNLHQYTTSYDSTSGILTIS